MRKSIVLAVVLLGVCALVATGCGSMPLDSAEMRAELRSHAFVVDGEGAPHLYHDSTYGPGILFFDREWVMWQYDDVSQVVADSYVVDAEGHIVATHSGHRIEGRYDRDSGRLKLDGHWYVARAT
jgi:hypothetical protein